MRIQYDQEADALYIQFKDGEVECNQEAQEGVILDLNKKNEVVGVEILDASKKMSPSGAVKSVLDFNIPAVASVLLS